MMTKLATLKKKWMRDPEFQDAYRKADGEYSVIEALIRARTKAKMSQTDLARKLGTTQSAVARLESGRVSPTVATLRRYAEATGSKLEIALVSV